MHAWIESNLKAFTKSFGEWISWTYQRDNMNALFNPLICISTSSLHSIEEDMKVLIKGKSCNICFSEKEGAEFLKDMLSPMEESSISLGSKTTVLANSKAENDKFNAGNSKSDINDMSKDIVVESSDQASVDRHSDVVKGQANKDYNVSQNVVVSKDSNSELTLSGSGIERVSASEEEDIVSTLKEPQKDPNILSKPKFHLLPRAHSSSLSSDSDCRLSTQFEEQSSIGSIIDFNPQTSL